MFGLFRKKNPPATAPDPTRPSICSTKTLSFLGKTYELKWESSSELPRVYEFFLSSETPQTWTELMDLRINPVHPDGNEPEHHAARLANLIRQSHTNFELVTDEKGVVLLDFLDQHAEGARYQFEFNAFKFFRDAGSAHVLVLHYAKNYFPVGQTVDIQVGIADIRKLREEVIPALYAFPLFRQ